MRAVDVAVPEKTLYNGAANSGPDAHGFTQYPESRRRAG